MRRLYFLTIIIFAGYGVAASAHAAAIDDLQPGQWFEFQSSQMSAVDPANDPAVNPNHPGKAPWGGAEGQLAVMDDWAGGAYDTSRDRLMVWGGGHWGYAGNEVYAFSITTGQWTRLTDPSTVIELGVGYYPDGKPASTHSYDQLEYLPSLDSFVTFGLGGYGFSSLPNPPDYSNETVALNLATNQWSTAFNSATNLWQSALAPKPDQANEKEYGQFSAMDGDGNVWVHTNEGGARLHKYIVSTNTWTTYKGGATYYGEANAAIDTKRNRMIAIGMSGGGYANNLFARVWDLNNPDSPSTELTGVSVSFAVSGPGLVYDPIGDRFLLWNGGTTVHTLNAADLKTWGTVPLYSGNTVTPTAPNSRGTYGRFRYVPSKQAVIVVNSTTENVYLFKLRNGSVPQPTVTLNATPSTTVAYQGSITLTWSSTDATSCTASGAWFGAKATSGNQTLTNLTAGGTYTLSCIGSGGSAIQSTAVTVSNADTVEEKAKSASATSSGAMSLAGLAFLFGIGALVRYRLFDKG